jgi:hypothetical protein
MKKIKMFVLVIFVACLFILFFKTEWLVLAFIVNPAVPLGTLIVWLLVVAYSLLMFFILPNNSKNKIVKLSKRLLNYLLYPSFFWGVVSYLLSGNWAFNFTNKINFTIWIIYTALIMILPLVVLVIIFMRKIVNRMA